MNAKKTILLVDDDSAVRSVMRRALQRMNYDVLESEDGRKVLGILRSSYVDAVILDLIMPNKEGIETLIEIQREGLRVPVVVLSGGGQSPPGPYLESAHNLGASAILTKPVDLFQLERTLAKLIEGREDAGTAGNTCME